MLKFTQQLCYQVFIDKSRCFCLIVLARCYLLNALKIQCFVNLLSDSRFLEGNWMNVPFVGCAALLAYFIYKKLSSLGDCYSLKARSCFLLWLHFKPRP